MRCAAVDGKLTSNTRAMQVSAIGVQDAEFLSDSLKTALERQEIKQLFPVQAAVVPVVLSQPHRDVCVAVPTGSGKTLAYAVTALLGICPLVMHVCRSQLFSCCGNVKSNGCVR